jgi:hypothetical protein
MAKTYEKVGNILKEIDTKIEEKEFNLRGLKKHKQWLTDEINRLQAEKVSIQMLIDKCAELIILEEN